MDFKEHWKKCKTLINNVVEIITEPWKVCVIDHLLENDSILQAVRREFYELEWNRRRLDLYEFHQSLDLQHINSEQINSIYHLLKCEVMPWVAQVMEVELNDVSATCSFYSDTDFLLVHDDREGSRVVAFVLYMSDVDEWEKSWGGNLQLFGCDEDDQPTKIVNTISPIHNRLVLFPVTTASHHSVDEVTVKNFSRLSINGWFHFINLDEEIPPYEVPPDIVRGVTSPSIPSEIELNLWINKNYLGWDNIEKINAQIESSSEISLVNFFMKDKFAEVLDALEAVDESSWRWMGPPNRFNYRYLDESDFPRAVSSFVNLFKSKQMFALMEEYTEINFKVEGALIRYELQKWTSGCYMVS